MFSAMNLFVGLAILAVLAIPLAVAIWRSNELFCLEVDGGRVRFVRGRIPQRLLDDLADVLRRPPVSHARLRAVSEDRRPRIVVSSGKPTVQMPRSGATCGPSRRCNATRMRLWSASVSR